MSWRAGVYLSLLLASACGQNPPQRDCHARIWSPEPAQVLGSFNGYRRGVTSTMPHASGWSLARLKLPAGEHGYLVDEGAGPHLDPYNPLTTFEQGREVSLLQVPDCAKPRLMVTGISHLGDQLKVEATFLSAESGEPLDPSTLEALSHDQERLTIEEADPDTGAIRARLSAPSAGKASVQLRARDLAGVAADNALAAAWDKPRELRDEVLYQIMVDRFRGPDGRALPSPATPGSRAGGTLDGVRDSLDELRDLGVSSVWLSPLYQGPDAPRKGLDGYLYEGYHGYWPVDGRTVEARFGGSEALDALVAKAHQDGLKLILDVVPNHVYEGHPRYRDHQADGWFADSGCVCGTKACPWGQSIERCWFTDYLPDIRWQHPDAARELTAEINWWMRRFDLDGVRIDAVPMMPRAATRRIAQSLRKSRFPSDGQLLLGEIFTGPGSAALQNIERHLSPVDLDSAFDFPLMWSLRDAIARGSGRFAAVEEILLEEERTFGSAPLGRMLDNHDTSRFISVAHGDADGDPWLAPAKQPQDDEPYARSALGLTMIFTLPGFPVLYQGDEIGLAGAGDPDSRRVMPSESELLPQQRQLRDLTGRLARLRRCSKALRRGDRKPLLSERHHYGFSRTSDDETITIVLNTGALAAELALPSGSLPAGRYLDVLNEESIVVASGSAPLAVAALSGRVLVAADHACAQP